ncbi:MAG: (2Fe-2S)-binding protein [Clostridiaceae bacterium]|nr:(2Fe-2S)-binding protein [Clostridiaceae bacterium]
MEQNINNEIMDKLTKICLCKAIPRSTIKKAIQNGANTVEDVQKVTGAGTGGCKGQRCTPKIEQLIKQELEKSNSYIL